MLQSLNTWGRKSLIACIVVAVTGVSLIGSPEVPGKVMSLAGFDLVTGIDQSTLVSRPAQ